MATDVERLIVALEARTTAFERAMRQANGTANRQARSIERRFQQMNKNISGQFTALGGTLTKAFALAGGIRGAQTLVDSATRIENALKVAGLEGENLTQVYDRLFQSAQRNAAPLETLVTLYGRAALVQNELKVSQAEMLNFTDKVAMALRVAGTDAQSASGALLQLSQALGSGVVRAEEFNSILEGALPIAQAAAAGLKEAGGSVARLRQLIVDGKVSSEAFFRAFEAGSVILEEKVAGAELTVSQHLVRLRNVLIDAAGDFEKGSGAAETFGKMLSDVADIISQTDFTKMGEEIAKYIGWVNDARLAVMSWLQAHGAAVGRSIGADSIGEMITGGAAFRQFGPVTITSSKALQRRIDEAFGGAIETAGDLTEKAVQDAYRRRGQIVAGGKVPRLEENKRRTVSLEDYDSPSDKKKKGSKRENDYARETRQIQERIAALNAETEAQRQLNPLIDDYGYAVEKARAKQELLTAAKRAGIAVTPELEASIDKLAEGYANASVEAAKLSEAQDKARQSAEEMRDLGKNVLGGFIKDLQAGKSATEALEGALGKVADKLLDIALNSIFDNLGFGGGSAVSSSWLPNTTAGAFFTSGFSSGTANTGGRRGEPRGIVHGQEAVIPLPSGGKVPVEMRIPNLPQASSSGLLTIRVVGVPGKEFDATVEKISGQVAGVVVQAASRSIAEQGAAQAEGNLRSGRSDGAMSRFGVAPQPRRR